MAVKFSVLGAQCTANAAAVATALGGGVATADVTALGAILTALSTNRPDVMYMMCQTVAGPGGQQPANMPIPG